MYDPHRSPGEPTHKLGDFISLEDLLALPWDDGNRYTRDREGRLILSPPDDYAFHRVPLAEVTAMLVRQVNRPDLRVVQEPSVVFDPIYKLDGSLLPPSAYGLRCLIPDCACIRRPARVVQASEYSPRSIRGVPEDLALVVELLSPSTRRNDLGTGNADDVDKWRTYLAARIPEYWIINANDFACGLPPRSCLALRFDASLNTWAALPVEDARYAPDEYRGHRVLLAGRVRSWSVPEVIMDIEQFWRDADLAP